MTLIQAITNADSLRPNAFGFAQKVYWVSELDGRVKREILDTHEGFEGVLFDGYTDDDGGRELLVPEPYSCIYAYWLFMKMDFMNGETARFNNSAIMHNTAWLNYANYVNRTREPKRISAISGAQ